MADKHMRDLRSSSPEVAPPSTSVQIPVIEKETPSGNWVPKRSKRTRPSVKSREEREPGRWGVGFLAFFLTGLIGSVGMWVALWHIPEMAPWNFAIKGRQGSGNLAAEISWLCLLHTLSGLSTFHGYSWQQILPWLQNHGFLAPFRRIMFESGGSGFLLGIGAFWWFSRGRLLTRHIVGKRLFDRPMDAIQDLKGEIRKSGRGIRIHPDVSISQDRETRHFFIMGAIGSGKTQIILNILQSIRERMKAGPEDRLIVYDNKSDMTANLPLPDDQIILLAPWDARTWAWDIGKDIVNATDAATFAERLIPESKDKFWSEAPRQIVRACIQHLQATHGTGWSWKDLSRALNTQESIIGAVMLYAPTLAPVFAGPGGPTNTGASLLSSMNAFTGSINDLCRAWDNTDPFTGEEIEPGRVVPRVSLRDWALTPTVQRRVIILQGNKRYLTLERAYIQAIVSAFGGIMNSPEMPDSKTRRIWVLLDEFPQLGKLEQFSQYLEVGRSKGLCVILGIQDLSQLREIYGRATADVWASICGTYLVCRSQGVETVQWLTRFFGEKTVQTRRISVTRSHNGVVRSITEERKAEPVVTSHVLNGLGDNKGTTPGILALLSLNTERGVYRLVWPYVSLPIRRKNQVPALWTHIPPKSVEIPSGYPFPDSGERGPGKRTKRRGKALFPNGVEIPID